MMKKSGSLLAVLLILACALCAAAAAETAAGTWTAVPHEAAGLPEDAQAAFDAALEGLVGAQYVPVALLSTHAGEQAGYCLLCQVTPVVPDPVPGWALVYIEDDGQGGAAITNVYDLYIDRHSTR